MPRQNKGYQEFPIYNFDKGMNTDREPWLIPTKAFELLYNFHIRRGVVEKRLGYTEFGRMVHQYVEEIATGDGITTTFAGAVSNYPIRPESSRTYFNFSDGNSQLVYDEDMDGSLSGDGSGNIYYSDGSYSMSFDSPPANGNSITCTYNYTPELPITGIYSYYSDAGDRTLLACDTKRINAYYPLQSRFQDLTGSEEFTGDASNYVNIEVWNGHGYITNNKDVPLDFDGSTVSELATDINNDGANDINRCLIFFTYKEHLIALRPTEFGSTEAQRVRWSAPGDADDWYNGGYVDAPTLDWIMGASFLGDRLIVFFERSIWALNYVGDVDMVFTWEKLISTEGCSASFSPVAFANEVLFLGPVEFIATDGVTTDRLTTQIPEYALNFDQDNYGTVYGAVLEEEQEVFWNFPEVDNSMPNKTLVYNYLINTWSVSDLGIQAIGYYYEQTDYTWDQIDQTWDDIEWTWDQKSAQSGYPTTLGGDQSGYIWKLNSSGSDGDGNAIEAVLLTKALNPFAEQNRNARLGYLDISYTIDEDTTIDIEFYDSESTTPYLSKSTTLTGVYSPGKGWRRIAVNKVASFHQVKITNNAANQSVVIHAFNFWFQPAGRLTQI